MKKIIYSTLFVAAIGTLTTGCLSSSGEDGAALGKEVCDCETKMKALPEADLDEMKLKGAEKDKCLYLREKNWKLLEGDIAEQNEYSKNTECQ